MTKKLRELILIAVAICLSLTTACGQKGPLYHPDKPPPIKTKAPND